MTVNRYECLLELEDEYITHTDSVQEDTYNVKPLNIDGEVINKYPRVVRRCDGLLFAKLSCLKGLIGRMIGPKGVTIKNFMETTHTKITWKEENNLFLIEGRKLDDVILAYNLMEWTIEIFQIVKGKKIKINSYDQGDIPEGITKHLNYGRKAYVISY